ncbi:MAG: hypothetical protein HY278_10710 [candidate division NC10 bacterium]|nr:hypothetical protein [candidate division NC10 bacterium]
MVKKLVVVVMAVLCSFAVCGLSLAAPPEGKQADQPGAHSEQPKGKKGEPGTQGKGALQTVGLPTSTGALTNKDQCKKGGWAKITTPRTFKNQGDCIQFVNTGK